MKKVEPARFATRSGEGLERPSCCFQARGLSKVKKEAKSEKRKEKE